MDLRQPPFHARNFWRCKFSPLLLLLAFLHGVGVEMAEARPLRLYAAASLGPVMESLKSAYRQQKGETFTLILGSSAVLARQILAGAPADIFITANVRWMDELAGANLILPESRSVLAGNQLILATGRNFSQKKFYNAVQFKSFLQEILTTEKLALCETSYTPCGIYAREALAHFGLWEESAGRRIYGVDALATANWLLRGEVAFAILYQSDIAGRKSARALYHFPPDSHAPIRYVAARLKAEENEMGKQIMAFLTSPETDSIWTKAGFTRPVEGSPPEARPTPQGGDTK